MKFIFNGFGLRQGSTLFMMLIASYSIAQDNFKQIQLLDQDTKQPIEGAVYQYGNQSGISDNDGIIKFKILSSKSMILSHLSYGQWVLSPIEVIKAMESDQLLRKEQALVVQPVTILALRTDGQGPETINVDNQDRLAHDGGELLSQTPLISGIRKSGNYGFDPVMRGFKYDQLNVVIDGAQSATAACPNRMDPPTSQIAPNMIQEVEVLKGPHSLRYGTAFGGTINFVTTSPKFSDTNNLYGRVTGAYESNGNIGRSEGLIGFSGSNYDIGLFGSWSQGDDYTDGDGNSIPSKFLRNSFGALIGLKINSNQTVKLSATRNMARDVDFPALPMDLRNDDTWMFNANHKVLLNKSSLKSWNTTVYASFVDHYMDNLLKSLDPRMMNASTAAYTKNYGGRTEGTWKFNSANLYVGADYKVEAAEGKRTREFLMGPNAGNSVIDNAWQDGQITKTGIFSEYQLNHKTINFVFSGRLEINNSKINDATPEFIAVNPETSVTEVNPGLSVGGIKTFTNGLNLGLWLGHAQRSGSLTERYINYFPVGQDPYEMIGNPLIKPEVNNQIDISFGYLSSGTSVELSLFSSFLKDYISSEIRTDLSPKIPSSPGVRQFVNIDNAFMTGFEVSWNQKLFAGMQHRFSVAYTYGQNTVIDEALPEIAPLDLRYSIHGSYLNGNLTPELLFRYVVQQDRISASYGETISPSFALLDLKVNYQIIKSLSTTVGVNNLFDAAYYEHLNRSVRSTPNAIMAPGRNIFISLTLDLM
ncbi:MAG: TonB-dependent receptor [Bacteroidetes bacterium]|nr:MAG: TonB-dependent receptor [Bacteroidota bacterium]